MAVWLLQIMPLKKLLTTEDITAMYLQDVKISQDLFHRLDELEKKLHSHESNPAVVGLAGFAITTILMQFYNLGLISSQPAIWIGMFVGGLAQLCAGLQERSSGDNFAYSAFTTFGAFWMAFGALLLAKDAEVIKISHTDLGAITILFTIYAYILLGAAFKINAVLFTTVAFLSVGLTLLDIGSMMGEGPGEPLHMAGGISLIICSVLAFYLMAHDIYQGVYGMDVLPVGPALFDLLSGRHRAHQQKRRESLRLSATMDTSQLAALVEH